MDCASGPYAETQIERSSQNLQSFNLMRCNRKIMISEFLGGEMECEKHPSTIHSLNYPIRSTVHRNRPRTNTRPFVRPFGLYTCPTMRFQTVYLTFKGPCKLFIPAFKASKPCNRRWPGQWGHTRMQNWICTCIQNWAGDQRLPLVERAISCTFWLMGSKSQFHHHKCVCKPSHCNQPTILENLSGL